MTKITPLKGISPGVLAATAVFKAEAQTYKPQPVKVSVLLFCMWSVNNRHHWLLDAGYYDSHQIRRCTECGDPWPWERGCLAPIASVIPRSYQKDGAEYLRRL